VTPVESLAPLHVSPNKEHVAIDPVGVDGTTIDESFTESLNEIDTALVIFQQSIVRPQSLEARTSETKTSEIRTSEARTSEARNSDVRTSDARIESRHSGITKCVPPINGSSSGAALAGQPDTGVQSWMRHDADVPGPVSENPVRGPADDGTTAQSLSSSSSPQLPAPRRGAARPAVLPAVKRASLDNLSSKNWEEVDKGQRIHGGFVQGEQRFEKRSSVDESYVGSVIVSPEEMISPGAKPEKPKPRPPPVMKKPLGKRP